MGRRDYHGVTEMVNEKQRDSCQRVYCPVNVGILAVLKVLQRHIKVNRKSLAGKIICAERGKPPHLLVIGE